MGNGTVKQTPDFWVGDRVVRPSLGEIQRGLEAVHLEPRSIEVLVALSERAGDVASKEELIEAVWGDNFVSDEVLTHAIWDLRRAFGDNASNPEFIQTIPKRGYRLIAPMKPVERETKRPRLSRTGLAGLAAAALVLPTAGIWLSRPTTPTPPPATGETTILVTPMAPLAGAEDLGEAFETHLLSKLHGIPKAGVRAAPACAHPGGDQPAYCVQPILTSVTEAFQVSARLIEAESLNGTYSTPEVRIVGRGGLASAADEIARNIGLYLEIRGDRDFPDLAPWISFRDHQLPAIRDFLAGYAYSILNISGSVVPLTVAIDRDPGFVGPRVFRTGDVVDKNIPAQIEEHRTALTNLYKNANRFEKPMILWALALIDDDPAAQLKHVGVALEQAPDNRPLKMLETVAHRQLGNLEAAWATLESVLQTNWEFPGLYALAGETALLRGEIEDARHALEIGSGREHVATETLALLRLLAIYQGEEPLVAEYTSKFESRLRELGEPAPDVSGAAESLAQAAESEGREEISRRLREFAD